MGFLKNAVKNGLSDGLSKGIKDAVNSAVESAVKPVADKYANAAASQLDKVADEMNANLNETNESLKEANEAAKGTGFGFANLEASLNKYASSARSYATELAKNFKECPNCGEMCEADRKFCPKCGAKLPDTTMADGLVCPKCGHQNTLETRFCSECGEPLPAYADEIAKEQEELAQRKAEEEAERLAEEQRAKRQAEYEATKKQVANKLDEKFGFINDATKDVREKATEVGGEAVNKALDLAGGLFKKLKK